MNAEHALTADVAIFAKTIQDGAVGNAKIVSMDSMKLHYVMKTVSSDYMISDQDSTLLVDGSAGIVHVLLPDATFSSGKQLILKKIDSTNNDIRLVGLNQQIIDNDTSYVLTAQFEYVALLSNGTSWMVVGGN